MKINKDIMCRQKKLPSKIKIGYAEFKVRHIARKSEKTVDMGEMEFVPNHVIRLFGKQENSELANSLFHEILHGINYVFDVPFKNVKEEEKYVRHTTNGMMTVFKDNPELLDLLKSYLHPDK
jgi:hypothetical protein